MSEDAVDYIRQEFPDLCRDWGETEWSSYRAKIAGLAKGGSFVAAAGMRLCARAVSESFVPRSPGSEKGPKESPSVSSRPRPDIDAYLAEIRRKFDALMQSHHRRSIASYVETLYRDLMFAPWENDAQQGNE